MSGGRVTLEQGAGGVESAALVEALFRARLGGGGDAFADAATVDAGAGRLHFSTDTFVVSPVEFPGGDLGKLAVCGTANDLAVSGARPVALSAGFVIEEGTPLDLLGRLVDSMAAALREIGAPLVTGDTKVVPHGQCDLVYVNTAGIGRPVVPGLALGPDRIRPGDAILLSGPPGHHGLAVLAAREGLTAGATVDSDCAYVGRATTRLLETFGDRVRLMRDPTRGGVATTLWEIARDRPFALELDETTLPVSRAHHTLAEMLGLDLLHMPCEGRFLAVVDGGAAGEAVALLRESGAPGAARVGAALPGPAGRVTVRTAIGGRRALLPLSNEQLPRIC